MLVNPSVQQPSSSVTAYPGPSQVEVGREEVVRSDLPPVEQASNSSGAQNQQLQNDQRFAQDFQRETANEQQVEQRDQSNRQTEDSSLQAQQEDKRLAEEQAIERQLEEDQAIIAQLKSRDREVRVHEAAHAAVGGKYAGAPNLQYERGPDGVNYAVSGEVPISLSKVPGDPEATLEKARIVRAAALAPAEPSAQDRRVAAEASQIEAEARVEIQTQKVEAEQARKDRVEQSREEELADEAANDAQTSEEVEVEVQEVSVASSRGAESGNQSDNGQQQEGVQSQESSTTARDDLEEILLGNQPIATALNQAGYVDAQNPYGKSGFIELIV